MKVKKLLSLVKVMAKVLTGHMGRARVGEWRIWAWRVIFENLLYDGSMAEKKGWKFSCALLTLTQLGRE